MIAGPSEILVIADADNDPDWIALDLLSQAEHDESAQSILITTDAGLRQAVARPSRSGWKRWNAAPSPGPPGRSTAR
jgi:histidinol dehydrogenase